MPNEKNVGSLAQWLVRLLQWKGVNKCRPHSHLKLRQGKIASKALMRAGSLHLESVLCLTVSNCSTFIIINGNKAEILRTHSLVNLALYLRKRNSRTRMFDI